MTPWDALSDFLKGFGHDEWAAMATRNNWTAVTDGLPGHSQIVLVLADGVVRQARCERESDDGDDWDDDDCVWINIDDAYYVDGEVTHWRPMIELPDDIGPPQTSISLLPDGEITAEMLGRLRDVSVGSTINSHYDPETKILTLSADADYAQFVERGIPSANVRYFLRPISPGETPHDPE